LTIELLGGDADDMSSTRAVSFLTAAGFEAVPGLTRQLAGDAVLLEGARDRSIEVLGAPIVLECEDLD